MPGPGRWRNVIESKYLELGMEDAADELDDHFDEEVGAARVPGVLWHLFLASSRLSQYSTAIRSALPPLPPPPARPPTLLGARSSPAQC